MTELPRFRGYRLPDRAIVAPSSVSSLQREFEGLFVLALDTAFELVHATEEEVIEARPFQIEWEKKGQRFVLFEKTFTEVMWPATAERLRSVFARLIEEALRDLYKRHPVRSTVYIADEPRAWLQMNGPSIVGGVFVAIGEDARRTRRRLTK